MKWGPGRLIGATVGALVLVAIAARVNDDEPNFATGNSDDQGPSQTFAVENTVSPPSPASSTTVVGDAADAEDNGTIRVLSYTSNVPPTNPYLRPLPGNVFAAIEVESCAGRSRSLSDLVNPFFFALVMADDTQIGAGVPVKEPAFDAEPLDPGACRRGWVTFEIPAAARPQAVVFDGPGRTLRWSIT